MIKRILWITFFEYNLMRDTDTLTTDEQVHTQGVNEACTEIKVTAESQMLCTHTDVEFWQFSLLANASRLCDRNVTAPELWVSKV